MKKLIMFCAALALLSCPACKKSESPDKVDAANAEKPAQNAEKAPAKADNAAEGDAAPKTGLPADAKTPEQIEKYYLSLTEDPVIPADLQKASDDAAKGDRNAQEKLIMLLTDTYAGRDYYEDKFGAQMNEYLTKGTEFKDPEVILARAFYEVTHQNTLEESVKAAKPWIEKALVSNNKNVLDYLLKNEIFGYRAEALRRIKASFAEDPLSESPKGWYDQARAIEFDTFSPQNQEKYIELLTKSARGGYVEAQALYANHLMTAGNAESWVKGFKMMADAAVKGDADANLDVANKLFLVAFSSDEKEVAENSGMDFTKVQYDAVRSIVPKANTIYESIIEYAQGSKGKPEACDMLIATGIGTIGQEVSSTAFDAAIECLKQFTAAPGAAHCERVIESYALFTEIDEPLQNVLKPDQFENFSKIQLDCIKRSFDAGDFYTDPYLNYSSALKLATLYSDPEGDKFTAAAPELEKQYLIYAAAHDDTIAQFILGKTYEEGKKLPQNGERACYWYKRAAQSKTCTASCAGNNPEYDMPAACRYCLASAAEAAKCQ